MNRRSILSISAVTVLGLALVPGVAVSQQKSLKDQLVGTWTAVSDDFTPANGTKQQRFGANPKGILIFDAGGRYADLGGRPDRPKYKTPGQPTTEERAAAGVRQTVDPLRLPAATVVTGQEPPNALQKRLGQGQT